MKFERVEGRRGGERSVEPMEGVEEKRVWWTTTTEERLERVREWEEEELGRASRSGLKFASCCVNSAPAKVVASRCSIVPVHSTLRAGRAFLLCEGPC